MRQLVFAVACLALAAACGGEAERPRPSGAPMSDPQALARRDPARAGNRAPAVEGVTFRPSAARAGEPVHARVDAHDPDGDALRLSYRWEVNGRPVPGTGAELRAEHVVKGASIRLVVVAHDGLVEGPPHEAWLRAGNQPPRIRWVRVNPARDVAAGMTLRAQVEGHDVDGDALEYDYVWLVNDREVARATDRFASEGLRRGDRIQVRVVARDGRDRSDPVTSPAVTIANAAPVIHSKPAGVDRRGRFHYAVRAEDPDGDLPLRFSLLEGPEGMRVDAGSGEVSWQARPDQGGRHVVEIAVEDRAGGIAAQRFELAVQVGDPAPAALAP